MRFRFKKCSIMNMIIPTESPSEEKHGGEQESLPSLTHHPSAPSDELFDISTTVDPGYVISLIRKLLPIDVKNGDISGEQKTEELKTALVSASENCEGMSTDDENKSLDVANDVDEIEKFHRLDVVGCGSTEKGLAAGEEAWEEYGCILWDLAASKPHAEFMVQNLILEVLFSSLVVSKSARMTEISLGIIGNLACHELSRKMITSTNGLTEAVLEQLFLDDIPGLCEACRVVTLCLQGDERVLWAEALRSEHLLSRILWIVENTLNLQLIHKSVGLLLAALQSKQVAVILQPPLMKLGLLRLLVDLLSFEMRKLREERLPERYYILDLVLQTIEALSVMDESSQEICADKELFVLLTDLIKLPEKFEVADSCVTAVVLIANILTDAADLTLEISQADAEATKALWSIIARFLVQVLKLEQSPLQLHQYVSVITSESEVIEEELLDDHSAEEHGSTATLSRLVARNAALNSIVQILNQWMSLEDRIKESAAMGKYHVNKEDAHRLLHCCEQYIKRD